MSAFNPDALWAKSKLFVERAVLARDISDIPSFHLWAANALELLGKAALAKVHPALVCDPTDQKSLLHACGIKDPPDKRSITAKTTYERLQQLSPSFDTQLKDTCMLMANRRNAELHSGESPVAGLDQRAWVPSYWRAVSVILQMQGKSLVEWLGSREAASVQSIIADASKLHYEAVLSRISRKSRDYALRYAEDGWERKEAKARSYARSAPPELVWAADEVEEHACPACCSKGWLVGSEWSTEVIDSGFNDGDPEEPPEPYETVLHSYTSDSFQCPECGLRLNGTEEIGFAGLPEGFEKEETREPDYEPDYGND